MLINEHFKVVTEFHLNENLHVSVPTHYIIKNETHVTELIVIINLSKY
jgi:hypothetical protein